MCGFYFANRSHKSSHQEEHPLLEALPRQLAEAAEPDELLEDGRKMNALAGKHAHQLATVYQSYLTDPAGDGEVVDAGQIFLQL